MNGVKLFDDGIAVESNLTGSVPQISNVMFNFHQINFDYNVVEDQVTYSGAIVPGGASVNVMEFQGVVHISLSKYMPGPGVFPSGVIQVNFPAYANPGFPGALPVEFAPGGGGRNGMLYVRDGGVVKLGAFYVTSVGYLFIGSGLGYNGDADILPFTANGDNGIYDNLLVYFA